MAEAGWLRKLAENAAKLFGRRKRPGRVDEKGMLVFSHTSEVIAAERALAAAGFRVEVKGPPPNLQTGCDLVVVFPLLRQAAVENALARAGLRPEQTVTAADTLLDPVSLFQVKDFGDWLMARAANMKITIDKRDGTIVNISGGGCPDVPWLAQQFCGKKLCEAPPPVTMGHTLCAYSLQKAYEELKRVCACGS